MTLKGERNPSLADRNRANKGKTYDEIYGVERGAKMREKAKVRAKAYSEKFRGISYEERYGPEKAAQLKRRLSEACSKRKEYITYEEKLVDPTWKVMMLPPVMPWKANGGSLFAAERMSTTLGAGRRW